MARRRGPGEGTIFRRGDGRWTALVDLGWADGRRQRKSIYGKSRAEVQHRLTAALRARQLGLPVRSDERMTTGAFLIGWLESVRSTIRGSTWISYAGHVRLHIVPRLGRLRLTQLQPQHVRALLEAVQATGRSARTAQLTHAVLRRALGQAARDGLVARNVATLVQGPRVRRDEVRPFDPHEARAFLAAIRGDRLEALYTVAIALGLRQGEALGLTWADVDLEAGRLGVRASLQRIPALLRDHDAGRGHRYQLVEPKTARSRRTLVLPRIVVDALREHRKRQLQERLWAGSRWSADWDLVFTTTIGTPLDARNVSHAFTAVLGRADLRRIRFHDLRHSAATLMLAQGVSARVIMEVLGHATIGTTLNLYAHVLPALQEEAADRMDAVLTGSVGS